MPRQERFGRKMLMPQVRQVFQGPANNCGIACCAMITGCTYLEALRRLGPPPLRPDMAERYGERERVLLHEKGWWESAQLLLVTPRDFAQIDEIIDSEERFKIAVEAAHRLRLVLAFADGTKPDHSVVWDRDFERCVLDPARGIIPIPALFADEGPQSYSGVLGFTSFCFQPGRPIEALIKAEAGIDLSQIKRM